MKKREFSGVFFSLTGGIVGVIGLIELIIPISLIRLIVPIWPNLKLIRLIGKYVRMLP